MVRPCMDVTFSVYSKLAYKTCEMMRSLGLVLFAVCVTYSYGTDSPVVVTKYGKVAGTTDVNFDGTKYYAFRGIPYAKPPVGELRFERPLPPDPWTDVRNASEEGGICIQNDIMSGNTIGSEDCLFLNVYVPEAPETLRSNEKPVMIYIHGGGFFAGSGNAYMNGPGKIMDYDVILVAFNYRLGIFGFLSTGDDHLPGNYGMWDQVQALKWVQENIKAFGGDPNKVTLFGGSAGAGSTSHHVLSPASKGLFHGAIFMSGNSLCPWSVQEDPIINARIVAAKLKCPTESSYEIEQCLRNKSTEEIFQAFSEFSRDDKILAFHFVPVIDGDDDDSDDNDKGSFLPEHPEVLLKKKRYNKVPMMMGISADEGAVFNMFNQRGYKFDKDFYDNLLESYLAIISDVTWKNRKTAANKVKKMYFDKVTDFDDKSQTSKPLNKLVSDVMVDVGMIRMAKALAKHNSQTYFYINTYRGGFSAMDSVSKEKNPPTHGDDCQYIFDSTVFCANGGKLEGKDKEVSRQMLTMWTNFAKTWNPTPKGVSKDIISQQWDSVSDDKFKYLDIGNELQMRKGFDAEKIKFWESIEKPERKMSSGKDEF